MKKILGFSLKKYYTTSLLILLILFSCKKKTEDIVTPPAAPTNFAEIKMSDIQAKESGMTTTQIFAIQSGTPLEMQVNNVYVFKTNDGRFGKFQVLTMNVTDSYPIKLSATVYNADGSVKLSNAAFTLRHSFNYDLDLMLETLATTTAGADFTVNIFPVNSYYVVPMNSFKLIKYTF